MVTNQSDILVSVVVPIYNVEEYLRQCVDSILTQTHKNLEILLVDDGSTDNSGRIVDKYARTDCRIKVVHKKNKGLSDARNVGTKLINGEYLFYLDSDDYIDSQTIEKLLNFALIHNCDIVQGGFYYLYPDCLLLDKRYGDGNGNNAILSKETALKYLLDNIQIKNFAWGKLYRTSLVIKHEFPAGKYFEDSFWQFKVINDCCNYGILNDPLTYYRQRKGSISCNGVNPNILDLIDGNIERTEFIKVNFPELFPLAVRSLWKSLFDICYLNGTSHKVFREKLIHTLDEYKNEFQTHLKKCIEYNLIIKNYTTVLSLLVFYKRVHARLTPSHIEKIRITTKYV